MSVNTVMHYMQWSEKELTVCGLDFINHSTTYNFRKVTCKDCIGVTLAKEETTPIFDAVVADLGQPWPSKV